MAFSILILLLLPFLDTSKTRSGIFKPAHFFNFVFFACVTVCLG
jgi:quinol-cytochrome oxidoreductase complex cytochrome b subunit